jgi:hypothetical protein
MTSLSIAKHGALPYAVVAEAIFIVESSPNEIIFEMLDADAEPLRTFLDVPSLYAIESQTFSGTLTSLGSCESTHPDLELLQTKPMLRGVLAVVSEQAATE